MLNYQTGKTNNITQVRCDYQFERDSANSRGRHDNQIEQDNHKSHR